MAKTDAASTKDFVDHSYFYKPYSIAAAIGFILWAAYVCWTGYWGIMKGRLPVIDIGMQLAILWWLLDTLDDLFLIFRILPPTADLSVFATNSEFEFADIILPHLMTLIEKPYI